MALLIQMTGVSAMAGSNDFIPEALPGAPAFPAMLRQELLSTLTAKEVDYKPRTQYVDNQGKPLYSNRLLLEGSPYLLQHAHNPVNWFPWGEEAFEQARKLNRPLFVSIGYSTCHWCHVMEEESFDNVAIAELINRHFIAVKVDREVRPDIDAIYMSAVQSMSGRGGWPLNVWLTPEGKPFHGGTYFPPQDQYGRPGFPKLLNTLHKLYEEENDKIDQFADELTELVRKKLESMPIGQATIPGKLVLDEAISRYKIAADMEWGGLVQEVKFPSSLPIRFLLRRYYREDDKKALEIALLTLDKMAAGGIYDQIGGGFHRYSTDREWLVPHFEKMLYDNAQLAVDYLDGWKITGKALYKQVVTEILDYIQGEMTASTGGFYSATDADSLNDMDEMEEGWYFSWTESEIDSQLGPALSAVFKHWYRVDGDGNLEGRNVLHYHASTDKASSELNLSSEAFLNKLAEAKKQLYQSRSQRPPPLRDDKIITAWNGLMISAFAQAGFAFNEPRYIASAQQAARKILDNRTTEGRLRRLILHGKSSGPAFLNDYALFISALLDLFRADSNPNWIEEAVALQAIQDQFYLNEAVGTYYMTASDQKKLLSRETPIQDNVLPSGNSVTANNLLNLYALTTRPDYLKQADKLFSALGGTLQQRPTELSEMLLALDIRHHTQQEIVLVNPKTNADADKFMDLLRPLYLPGSLLAITQEGAPLDSLSKLLPIVEGRRAIKGKSTAYVCENRVCNYPTSDPEKFRKLLQAR